MAGHHRLFSSLTAVFAAFAVTAATLTAWAGPQPADAPGPSPSGEQQALEAFADLPLSFVENQGQLDPRARYHAQGSDYAFFFTPGEVMLSFSEARGPATGVTASEAARARGVNLALRFVGADGRVEPRAADPTAGQVNYLRGDDPTAWRTGLPGYRTVAYRQVWPGIDMVLRGEDGMLKYEFRVRPGARPGDVKLAYAGARRLALDSSGDLLVRTAIGTLRDSAPVSYQVIGGERTPVDSRFVLKKGKPRQYGFAVGAYRRNHALVIDPGLDYSTFVGGSSMDRAEDVAVDSEGNAIVVGATQSTDFPTTTGAVSRTFRGGIMDAFVAKLNADGSGLVYATYLGGTPTPTRRGNVEHVEMARAVAVDGSGNAYLTGQTSSGDFPITAGAFQPNLGIGVQTATDAFVTKLTPTGGLAYSTFLGGAASDDGRSIAVDATGNAYIGGSTFAGDFPTTAGGFDTVHSGGEDVFAAKLNPTGSALAYSTLLGGADNELSAGIAVDASGNAYVAGSTRSTEFPTTAGSFQPTHSGGGFADLFEVFVTKLNTTGSGLVYSTFLGGSRLELADGLAIDSAGSAYVIGGTLSAEFPTTPGAFDTAFDSSSKNFAAKLHPSGSSLVYSTFLGRAGAAAVVVDADNNAWLAGSAGAGATTTPDAFQPNNNGAGDAYIAQLNATGSGLTYATYLGGADSDNATGIALDPAENIYVAGTTISADFPTTPGAFDRTFGGDPSIFWGDAFVAKFTAGTTAPPPADTTAPTVSVTSPAAGATVSGTVPVAASATDDVGVAQVRFFVDGTPIGTDTTTPYEVSWDTTTVANGTRVLTATASDAAGNTGSSAPVSVTVDNTAPAAALASLALSPTSVTGGNSSTGTVALDAPAPAGGVSVALASSNTAAATVPANVTVPAGSTSASFTVSTSSVTANTSSTISATLDGVTRTAVLTITAPAPDVTTTFSGRIDDNQTRTHTVSSGAGTVSLNLNWDDGRVDLDLRGRDPSGNVVFFDGGSARPKTGSFSATVAGDYRFDVINNTRRNTDYTLTVTHPAVSSTPPPADTTAPAVSVTSPAAGATVSGTAPVAASATDDVGVAQVRFFVDGTPIGTDSTAPYEVSWDTTTVANGTRVLTATASDAAGNTGTSATVTVTVDNTAPPADTTAPTVSVTSPASGATVSGTEQLVTASATDDVGVTQVRFFIDGTPIGTDTTAPYEISWDTTTVANGTRVLTATATDAAGNTGSADPVPVTVDNTAPAPALAALGLSPTSVTGGNSSTGTVTLDTAAPAGGVSVALASSNTAAATVPATVTVPAGSTSASFTVTTSSVSTDTSSTISATLDGVTRTAVLTVTAPAADTVTISRAEYDADKDELRVEASSSSAGATLAVYVTATDELIGTLSAGRGEFSWPTNPQNITVRSGLGGSATRAVQLK